MASSSNTTTPARLFFSYSSKDEALRIKLETHFQSLSRQRVIDGWHSRMLEGGEDWRSEVDAHLEQADIILLLISSDFVNSDYCYEVEMRRALERHESGSATVIPVILRPCDWKACDFGKLQALPENGKPITKWSNRDSAYTNVATGLRRVAEQINMRLDSSSTDTISSNTLHPSLIEKLHQVGISDLWRNRGAQFQEDDSRGRDYASVCRSVISSAKDGSVIRLMSTAGDGAIVFHDPPYDAVFTGPLTRGCRYQILLVKPTSDLVMRKQYAEDHLGRYGSPREKDYLAKKIRLRLVNLREWRDTMTKSSSIRIRPDSITIKCIDELPVVNLVDNSHEAIIHMQVLNRKGNESPVFHLQSNGVLYAFLQDYFDYMFDHCSVDFEDALREFETRSNS